MSETEKASPEEIRDELLGAIRNVARYWATLPDFDPATGTTKTVLDRCDGVAFSILCMLDGVSGAVGNAFDLVARVHPEDEDQSREGVVISAMLHELYGRAPAPEAKE